MREHGVEDGEGFNKLLKKSICVVGIKARHCGVYKNTPHSSLLDASHLELFEQPEQVLKAHCERIPRSLLRGQASE